MKDVEEKELKEDLGKRGNKLAQEYIQEEVKYSLKGDFGQALVVTEKAMYVLKWGFQTGLTFGGRCTPYPFSNVISVQIQKKLTSKYLEVITAGNQDKKLSYWALRGKSNSAMEAPNTVTFSNKNYEKFRSVVTHLQDKISISHATPNAQSATGELEKYADLYKKGVITQKEFAAKKKRLLGL